MQTTLAVASNGVFEVISNVFNRADTLAHPDALFNQLQQLSIVWAAIFFAAGIACMLQGYKHYKIVTVIMALMIGAICGYVLGKHVNAGYIVAGSLAALLAVCCWPLMKYAVAVMGGLVGAFVGANAWSAIEAIRNTQGNGAHPSNVHDTYWIGALMGLIICGMAAFILFKLSVVFFTAVSGATLALLGAMAMLLQIPSLQETIHRELSTNAVVLPLLAIVPALCGLILQHFRPEHGNPGGAHGGGGAKPSPKPA